ncbi:MAG: N-acetyltransferase [Rubrivivax sp.]|nr:N-acetyltransferase [Rubrivivax sp.]
MSIVVHHRPEAACFEAVVDGLRSECAYRLAPGVVTLHHTEVPRALQGRGVAAALVDAALSWARAQGLRVRPSCSYVALYMRRHPETQDLLDPPRGDPP